MKRNVISISLITAVVFGLLAMGAAGDDKAKTVKLSAGMELTLHDVFKYIKELTGCSVVHHGGAAAVRSLVIPTDIEADADKLFALVNVNGYTLEYRESASGNYYVVYDQRNLRALRIGPTRILQEDDPIPKENILVTKVIKVKYYDPQEIERALNTRIIDRAGAGSVLSIRGHPVLILRDFAPNVAYYEKVIKEMDLPPYTLEIETILVELKHADPSNIADILKKEASTHVKHRAGAISPKARIKIFSDPVNKRVVLVGAKTTIEHYEKIVKVLDREKSGRAPKMVVYRVEHANAEDIADALSNLIDKSGSKIDATVNGTNKCKAVIVFAGEDVQKELGKAIKEMDVEIPKSE